jgi:3-deoxy-D-manno-octulosonate 8-phosphate phosphatase KdsC-like HAD superfamily phosphatase
VATWKLPFFAAAQSASVVKLIRKGKVFADVTDVYTMTWDATHGLYEATLDDATFVSDYYRIEEGSANIAVEDFPVRNKTIALADIPDNFVRNDGDDAMLGELSVQPASGTDTKLRIGNETATAIRIAGENAAGSADRIIELCGTSVKVQNAAGTAVKITNIATPTAGGDAANKTYVDAVSTVVAALDTRVVALEGTGTFSSAAITLTATARRGTIGFSWSMDSSANESAVYTYELYIASTALAGHAAGTLSAAQLANIRANMQSIGLPSRNARHISVAADETLFCIVVASDHAATPNMVASAQVTASTTSPLDGSTPIVGAATSIPGAITTLAAELNKIQAAFGGGGAVKTLYNRMILATTATGASAAALVWTEATGSPVKKSVGRVYKDGVFSQFRIRFEMSTNNAANKAEAKLVVGTLNNTTATFATSATACIITLDCSSLADGLYDLDFEFNGTGGSTASVPETIIIEQYSA